MAVWIRDGFEFYTTTADMTLGSAYGIWDSQGGVTLSRFTRFGLGQSVQTPVGVGLVKAGFSNQATVFACFAHIFTAALGAATHLAFVEFRDGTTVQCTIVADGDGVIRVYSGTTAGTLLGTYSNAFASNQWNQFQIKAVINNTTGEVHIRKNGSLSDDFSLTSVNTRGGTANNYANAVRFGSLNGNSNQFLDDFASWDSSGASPWNDFVGDIRSFQRMPKTDNTVAWSQTNGGSTQAGNSVQSGGNTLSVNANTAQTTAKIIPTSGGTFTTMDVNFNAGFTGNAKVAVYDSDGDTSSTPTAENKPGTLLATSNALVNPGAGVNAFTFAAAVTLMNQHTYYFAILTDTNCVLKAGAGGTCWSVAQAYGSGFSNPSGMSSAGQNQPLIYVPTLTTLNSGLVNDEFEDGSTTFVNSSTVNQEDLYGVDPLPITPSSVLGVDVIILSEKSDAGARQLAAEIKSGGTTQTFATITPGTAFNYNRYQQDTDPNTAAAWTPSGINNALLGLKVIS